MKNALKIAPQIMEINRHRVAQNANLPNAVNVSPPCCLVKFTTRIVGESIDDNEGNTRDVGTGPPLHIATIDNP